MPTYGLHEIPGLRRIRYTSPHPNDINEKVMDLYGSLPKLCKNLHLPLQAGSNQVLRRMKRDYTREIYLSKVEYLRRRRPDIALSTDIIVGFPGEAEKDFELTMDIVREVEYSNVYSFKYSSRPYTAALRLEDNVSEEEKSCRLNDLQDLQKEIQLRLNATLVGTTQEVLVESHSKKDDELMSGRTSCNRVVNFRGSENQIGRFLPVDITAATANCLLGAGAN